MELSRMIDHITLKADTSKEAVMQIIEEAKGYRSYSICVDPVRVVLAKEQLQSELVAVCTVIRFPLGINTSETEAFETTDTVDNSTDEVDMTTSIGALKSKDDQKVQKDIEAIIETAKDRALAKVIIETSLLDREEIIQACKLVKAAGAGFVKTSTGFSAGDTRVKDVRLICEAVGPEMGAKASGGIHNEKEVMAIIEAGATKIGTGARIAIVSGSTDEGC